MRHYFLGTAAGVKHVFRHLFARGSEKDCQELTDFLSKKYGGEAILTKNGRSALTIALKTYLQARDAVLINGFTCHAVVEAVKAAGMVPVYADISPKDLNFTAETLEAAYRKAEIKPKCVVIQNTLGNHVDIASVENFAKRHEMVIIEDLAHCAGVKYADLREVGTVGDATVLSFGKEKSIDTVSGGAVILRELNYKVKGAPNILPQNPARKADNARARFYPLLGKIYRGLSYVKLNGAFMRMLLKLKWVEKSADSELDVSRRIGCFEAKLALPQLKKMRAGGQPSLRRFYLLDNRDEVLAELRKAGYYFDGFWYEKPVSPERYYKEAHFPETECPMAVAVSQRIINFPMYYTAAELAPAERIVREKGKVWSYENE